MAAWNFAELRKRGSVGFAAALIALGLALLGAEPAAALAPSETVMGLSLQRVAGGRDALAIRGASDQSTQFSAAGSLSRIPCRGSYRYELQSENQHTGALNSYTALVTLVPFAPDQSTPCGGVPPPRTGTFHVSVSGDEETIDFTGSRRNGSESFFGAFAIGTQPECHQRYTISVSVDLRGWDRSIRYRFNVANWESEAQGRPLESEDC